MTFLNPAFLWLALAVAVPIIVHLFNFRKPKRILFSNLSLLLEVNKVVARRLKLKQLLLLLLRILAFLFLVLAFAHPILKSSHTPLSLGRKSISIIIDNSHSMSATDERGVYLQQAILLAKEIIQSSDLADEFQLLTTSNLRLNGFFSNKGQALESLQKVDFEHKIVSYAQIINNLPYFFTQAKNQDKHLYFISDFQRSTVLRDTLENLSIPSDITTHFLHIGKQEQVNVYISEAGFENQILEKNKPITINLKVNNNSDKDIPNLSLKVKEGEKVVAISSVSLGARENKTTQITYIPETGGWHSGYIELDDTPIDFDNIRYFSYYIPEGTKILLVAGEQNMQYLNLLFQHLIRQFQVELINQRSLANVDLSTISTIVLAGVDEISSGLADKIANWVKEGGGIILFPSANMNTSSINYFLAQMQAGSFEKMVNYSTPILFIEPDLKHPIFQGVFKKIKKNAEFDSPSIQKIYRYVPSSEGLQNTVIKNQNNDIVLQEIKYGNGGLFIFSLYPALDWSDFPIKSSFVPIVYRSALLLNHLGQTSFSENLDNPGIRKIKTSSASVIKLQRKDGFSAIPEQFAQQGYVVLKFDKMQLRAGNYEIVQNDSVLEKISFNYSDAESQMETMPIDEL
ncbi:MAG: BatA and WFA domain-containing protein, partial [Bacteroidia bacterium]|nr:BatA domain-containing protein [Bacteroidia bacterium]MDW8159260.1 BatA and WFA domain-containing protein [Bacteroidia bacterium]